MQLQLQHTVEGLSIFAISYYAVGLLSYLAYPLAEAAAIERGTLIAALTPLVVVSVWLDAYVTDFLSRARAAGYAVP